MTKHRIEYVDIDDLVPADRNAKDHASALLSAGMDRFGFIESIVRDDRTGKIVGGHGRREQLLAARAEGKPVPDGIVAKGGKWLAPVECGWSSKNDDEALAAGIALNRIGEVGGWKYDELLPDLQSLDLTEYGLPGVGFVHDDIDSIMAALELARAKDDEPEPAAPPSAGPPKNPKTKPGDVWLLGDHRIICGDCRDADTVKRLLDGATINVAVTSPPYAEQRAYDESSGFKPIPPDEYVAWFADVARNVEENLEPDGSWFVNIKPPGEGLDTHLYVFDLVTAHVREWGWHFVTELCWERNGVPKQVTRRFKNQFEPIYQFVRGDFKIRPDNVRHASVNAIVPLGEGALDQLREAGSEADWSQVQGTGGDMFPKVGKRAKRSLSLTKDGTQDMNALDDRRASRTDNSFVRLSKTEGTTNPAPRRDLRPRPRNADRTGAEARKPRDEVQGTNWAPGDAQGAGFAYPGNRLPTFTGTHTAVGHSAAYPVGLPQWFVRAYSDAGDVVFDPFMGSGSTLLAAHNEGRIGYGVELSPGYCDMICARFQSVTGIVPVRLGSKRPTSFVTAAV